MRLQPLPSNTITLANTVHNDRNFALPDLEKDMKQTVLSSFVLIRIEAYNLFSPAT
jgi:hypothetical protein